MVIKETCEAKTSPAPVFAKDLQVGMVFKAEDGNVYIAGRYRFNRNTAVTTTPYVFHVDTNVFTDASLLKVAEIYPDAALVLKPK